MSTVTNFVTLDQNFRFNGALSLELTNDHPNMRVIHRKVALILGQWVSEVIVLASSSLYDYVKLRISYSSFRDV